MNTPTEWVKIFVNQFADKVEKMQKCCNHLKLNIRKAGDNQQTQLLCL
jgi:hypothetical protein